MDLRRLAFDFYVNQLSKPSTPSLRWPIGSNATGFKEGMLEALNGFFFAGAEQGFVLGVLTLLAVEFAALLGGMLFALVVLVVWYFSRQRSAS